MGGGIFIEESITGLTIKNVDIKNSLAKGIGGEDSNMGGGSGGSPGMGGGIFNWNSTLFIKEDVSFNNNQAEFGAGGNALNNYGEINMSSVCVNGDFSGCPTAPMTGQIIAPNLMPILTAGLGAPSGRGMGVLNGSNGGTFGVGGGGAGNSFNGNIYDGGEGSIRASSGEGTAESDVNTGEYLNGDGGFGGAFGAAIFNYEGSIFLLEDEMPTFSDNTLIHPGEFNDKEENYFELEISTLYLIDDEGNSSLFSFEDQDNDLIIRYKCTDDTICVCTNGLCCNDNNDDGVCNSDDNQH